MSEQNTTPGEGQVQTPTGEQQTQQTQQTPPQTPPDQGNITISREEYAQIVTQLAMLQQQQEQVQQQTQTPPQQDPLQGKHVNQLTNEELLEVINRNNEQNNQQIINALMQIAVKEEIRDLGDRYEDFRKDVNIRNEVFKIAEKNTHLSLEQAYMIHKGMKPATPPQQQTQTPTPPPPGERPSVSVGSVQESKPMSIREAAEAAFKTIKYQG